MKLVKYLVSCGFDIICYFGVSSFMQCFMYRNCLLISISLWGSLMLQVLVSVESWWLMLVYDMLFSDCMVSGVVKCFRFLVVWVLGFMVLMVFMSMMILLVVVWFFFISSVYISLWSSQWVCGLMWFMILKLKNMMWFVLLMQRLFVCRLLWNSLCCRLFLNIENSSVLISLILLNLVLWIVVVLLMWMLCICFIVNICLVVKFQCICGIWMFLFSGEVCRWEIQVFMDCVLR